MAEREVSYRFWSAAGRVDGFAVKLPFTTPNQGKFASSVFVGPDGDFALGMDSDWASVAEIPAASEWVSVGGFSGEGSFEMPELGSVSGFPYLGCFMGEKSVLCSGHCPCSAYP